MAEDSWPNSSRALGSITDAEYELLTHPVSGDGLVGTPADTDIVFADSSGLTVKVRADRYAVVRGRVYSTGGSNITVPIAANASGQTRIDLIVLRLDRSTWELTAEAVTGTPGSGAPALTQDDATTGEWEIPLAEVTVANAAVVIAGAAVTARAYYLGEPLIVCKAATRPGHAPGRRIYETDTGRTYISNGSATWLLIGQPVFTSGSRPSHQQGLLIYESNTKHLVVSDGAAWRYAQPPVFTSGTRPTHQQGLLIYESDTGLVSVSSGSAWTTVNRAVVCTSGTRPAHQQGLLIYETDTTNLLLSASGSWVVVREDTGWVTGTMGSGWTGPGNFVRVRRKNGWATASFLGARVGSDLPAGSDLPMFTLPAGYLPTQIFYTACDVVGGSAASGRATFNTSGQVTFRNDVAVAPTHYVTGSATWPI